MNCKQGEYAVIVRTGPDTTEHLGKIVLCKSLTTSNTGLPAWYYEKILTTQGTEIKVVEDCCLKPIRDSIDDDEVLCITGKPKELIHERQRAM